MAESGGVEAARLNTREDKGDDSVNDCYDDQKNEGEEATLMQNRRPKLSSLEIPMRSLETSVREFVKINIPSPVSVKAGLPPRPASARLKHSVKNLIAQKSFRGKNPYYESEKSVLVTPDMPASDQPSTSKSFLNKILSSAPTKSSASVPVTPLSNADVSQIPENLVDHQSNVIRTEVGKVMMRSLSVPVNVKSRSLMRTNSSGALIRVISINRATVVESSSTEICHEAEVAADDSGEDIPEEEAVCRICFVELGEGGETLKLECSCKGDLALAHKECAVKWFSIKGNKTCDVCKEDVKNLPVALLKIHRPPNAVRRSTTRQQQQQQVTQFRVWQDVPVLVLVSMLAYFFFLEQLLVSDMGARALAISLPFSCVLGLLSSMIASTMVDKRYIWAYASFQFATVILFAHIFYTVLNVNAVLSVMLSSFTGFGIVISTNSLISEYLRWRSSRHPQSLTRHEQRQHRTTTTNSNNHHHQMVHIPRAGNELHEATEQRL